jgi:hypothetical protein
MTAPALPFDPRVRVRDALRELIAENPTGWDRPSLFVVRNRLLDRTGSDARPYAELLLEAARRGWRDRLPATALDSHRWHATLSPFLLQWSADRFIQPEMARWALESWAYAMHVIDASQLTIAPPPRAVVRATTTTTAAATASREPLQAMAARLNARAAANGAAARTAAVRVGGTRAAGVAGAGPGSPAGGRSPRRATTTLPGRPTTAYGARGRASAPPVPVWVTKAMAATLLVMALGVVGRVVFATPEVGAAPAPGAASIAAAGEAPPQQPPALSTTFGSPTAAISPVAQALRAPVVTPEASTQLPPAVPAGAFATTAGQVTPAPVAANASPGSFAVAVAPSAAESPRGGQLVNPTLTGGVAVIATERPGVPSITKAVIPTAADSARMIFVQPARRASGASRPVSLPSGRTSLTYDELHLRSGEVLRGRVDVVQAGAVLFRDQKTGLRYEIRKDDIDEIISEFGTPIRFRAVGPRETGAGATVRAKGVAGRYRVRYAAASAVGSPECVQVWTKPPNAQDIAIVRHRPGDDTLSVAFEGGDNFPSNIDGEGWFASTFRIVPDQARTMTALTTRLNGRFLPTGTLQFAVNIVFFRRMRTGGDVTCNVTVTAEGKRE